MFGVVGLAGTTQVIGPEGVDVDLEEMHGAQDGTTVKSTPPMW
jgi:hypothetical protein